MADISPPARHQHPSNLSDFAPPNEHKSCKAVTRYSRCNFASLIAYLLSARLGVLTCSLRWSLSLPLCEAQPPCYRSCAPGRKDTSFALLMICFFSLPGCSASYKSSPNPGHIPGGIRIKYCLRSANILCGYLPLFLCNFPLVNCRLF